MSQQSDDAFRIYLATPRRRRKAALDELLRSLRPMMVRIARGMVERNDVDDVVQEALASVATPGLDQLQRGRIFREGPRSLGAVIDSYAAQVVRQKALLHRRREKARREHVAPAARDRATHQLVDELASAPEERWLEELYRGGRYQELADSFELPMAEILDTAADLERLRAALEVLRRERPRWARAIEIIRRGGTASDVARRLRIEQPAARKVLERARGALRVILERE